MISCCGKPRSEAASEGRRGTFRFGGLKGKLGCLPSLKQESEGTFLGRKTTNSKYGRFPGANWSRVKTGLKLPYLKMKETCKQGGQKPGKVGKKETKRKNMKPEKRNWV